MATLSVIIIIVVVVISTAHALVLTVSHGLLFRQPRYLRRHRCRRFSSPNDVTSTFHVARFSRRAMAFESRQVGCEPLEIAPM
jgi:hypothetical protein